MRMTLALILLGLAAALPGVEAITLDHGGMTRSYQLHRPTNLTPGVPVPLVLALHPSFSCSERFRSTATDYSWETKADSAGFVVAYPNGTQAGTATWPAQTTLSWNSYTFDGSGVDDLGYLRAVIDDVAARWAIDHDRIYITGFSNGAMMANTFAIVHSRLVAAVGPVSGGWITAYKGDAVAAGTFPAAPVPVWIWRGSAEDDIVTGSTAYKRTRAIQDQEQLDWWIDRNGTSTTPVISTGSAGVRTFTTATYSGGREGVEVRSTTVTGTSHMWQPGATDHLWDFFATWRSSDRVRRSIRLQAVDDQAQPLGVEAVCEPAAPEVEALPGGAAFDGLDPRHAAQITFVPAPLGDG